MSRTRLERLRAAVGIASLALQQIEDDLGADDVDQEELAARRAEQVEPDRDASCPLHEAAALITDNAGPRPAPVI